MVESTTGKHDNFLRFLGTAGTRFVTITQKRSSGGIWISYKGTNIIIDPGPGSLVACRKNEYALDPCELDAIIVTHKHIDHSNDVNIMIEAMTHGGSKKKGFVFVPKDMLGEDSALLNYACQLPEKIVTLEEKKTYTIGKLNFEVPVRHVHSVETYGIKFIFEEKTVAFISDTKYFETIADNYQANVLIMNTVFYEPFAHIDHLSFAEAEKIISKIKPQKAILTHFGRDVLNRGPEVLSKELGSKCGVEVVAAYDGMKVAL